MKTIIQKVRLAAPPERVYQTYMDPTRHSQMLGARVWISRKVGGRFSAWDGYCWGEILSLVPNRMIVQTWRTTDWKKSEHDSVLILSFDRVRGGTRLTMVHANVPDHQYAELRQGWKEHYWRPLRAYLKTS